MANIERPPKEWVEKLYRVSSATASSVLRVLEVRRAFIEGAVCRTPGTKAVGPALTLRFLPQREDVVSGLQEERTEKRSALWEVLEYVQPGDIIAVDARGDLSSGCFGEMLLTYFKGRHGAGVVVDGAIRDFPQVRHLGVPVWSKGVTPNSSGHWNIYPWDFNQTIGCGNTLVIPGDIIIADGDGAVVVPRKLAPKVIEAALDREEREEFERMKLSQGGALRKYYPLNEEGMREFQEWIQLRKQTKG